MTCPLIFTDANLAAAAETLASQFGFQLLGFSDAARLADPDLVLQLTPAGLQLQYTGRKAPGPIWVDFTGGAADHRRQFGGGRGQMVAKAVGLKPSVCPLVLDATAGLGGDSFVLASLGAGVLLQERNPVVYALLSDGLNRARHLASGDVQLQPIFSRMRLLNAQTDSTQGMRQADVIFLDPMFPSREKSAAVKKEMTAFHSLVGEDLDQDLLLSQALEAARFRVVVKRPRKAPYLAGQKPALELAGKSSRFDVYPIKKMPDKLLPDFGDVNDA
ncbi:class I SAM-dependent methyltransferase [Simiduia litorea]|uniref:class I SAM-dependent methyltransferase n=1 Tax=Simiduia litorea TaxID=1435348 RepID=UPI0036F3CD10